jgi:hypothetical protein
VSGGGVWRRLAATGDDLYRRFYHGGTEITEHHREDFLFYFNKYK